MGGWGPAQLRVDVFLVDEVGSLSMMEVARQSGAQLVLSTARKQTPKGVLHIGWTQVGQERTSHQFVGEIMECVVNLSIIQPVTLEAVQTDANACQTQPLPAVAPFTTIRRNPMPSDSNSLSLTSSHFIYHIAFLLYKPSKAAPGDGIDVTFASKSEARIQTGPKGRTGARA